RTRPRLMRSQTWVAKLSVHAAKTRRPTTHAAATTPKITNEAITNRRAVRNTLPGATSAFASRYTAVVVAIPMVGGDRRARREFLGRSRDEGANVGARNDHPSCNERLVKEP